jgi:hypothetical protein
LPVTRFRTIDDQFGTATFTQREAGVLRVDARTTIITNRHANASIARNVNSIEALLFDR